MPTARVGPAVGTASNGTVLSVGGFINDNGSNLIVAANEVYSPPKDVTPPRVTCSVSPNRLWPPNGQLMPVKVTVSVTDPGGSGPNGYMLVAITSNVGNIADEERGFVTGTSSTSGKLLAARNTNGISRIYTLTYQGSDVAGNTATCTVTVRVHV
jgi:hypothetical protein